MSQILLAVLFITLQTNQTAVSAIAPAEKRECQVAGTVVGHEGGEPIKNARVVLRPEGTNAPGKHYGLKTGEDGKFCFSNVPPGRYRLDAQRNGYVTQTYGEDDPSSSGPILAVAKEKKLEGLVIRLIRGGVISGKVLDADGEPAPGILVQALLPQDSVEPLWEAEGHDTSGMPKNGLVATQGTITNDLGEYRLAGLQPGEYLVNAVDTGGDLSMLSLSGSAFTFPEDDETLDKSAPTYYPAATRMEQAEKIPLKAGGYVSADIQLRHEKTVTVSGIVVREDGKPGSASFVTIANSDPETSYSRLNSQTDENGHFSISHVMPGNYTLAAISFEHDDMTEGLNARQKLEVGQQDVKDLRVVLAKGLTVTGKFSMEGGAISKLSNSYVALVGKDDDFSRGSSGPDKDGNFKITSLEAMTYQLILLNLPEEYYLKRVTYNGQSNPDHLVQIEPGVPPGKLELVVSSHPATIAGTVEDSNHAPVGGVTVVLHVGSGQGKSPSSPNHVITDQNGKFSFRGAAPGSYTVVAKKRSKSGSQPDSGETSFKVSEDEQKTITVKLQTNGT
jgi:protocatechuate 3,4-dioxygenase beta subunit